MPSPSNQPTKGDFMAVLYVLLYVTWCFLTCVACNTSEQNPLPSFSVSPPAGKETQQSTVRLKKAAWVEGRNLKQVWNMMIRKVLIDTINEHRYTCMYQSNKQLSYTCIAVSCCITSKRLAFVPSFIVDTGSLSLLSPPPVLIHGGLIWKIGGNELSWNLGCFWNEDVSILPGSKLLISGMVNPPSNRESLK